MFDNPSAPTTTTASPVGNADNDKLTNEQFQTVDQKLNAISSRLSVVSSAVFAFIVLAVVILAAFSVVQYWQNKKFLRRRSDSTLPKYVENPPYTK